MRHFKTFTKTVVITLGAVTALNLIAAGLLKMLNHRVNSN